jgi:hypothetical protein
MASSVKKLASLGSSVAIGSRRKLLRSLMPSTFEGLRSWTVVSGVMTMAAESRIFPGKSVGIMMSPDLSTERPGIHSLWRESLKRMAIRGLG